jgi:hypothetical protein
MIKHQSVIHPERRRTYEEWIELLRKEHNVIVSGLYLGRSIQERVNIDDAINYRSPEAIKIEKINITRQLKNLFGTKK